MELIDSCQDGNVVVARVRRRRIFEDNFILELGAGLKELIAREKVEKIVVNLSEVDFLSSSALGRLIDVNKTAKQLERRLLFSNVSPEVRRMLRVTRLDELFEIHADEAAAIAAA